MYLFIPFPITVDIRVESALENTLFIVELGHIFLIFSLLVYSLENVGNIDPKILGDRQNILVRNMVLQGS